MRHLDTIVMLRSGPFWPPGRHPWHVSLELLKLGAVRLGRQLHQRMQWHLHPGRSLGIDFHEVCVDAAQDCLVGDDEDVLGPLEFHYDWFDADDDIPVRFAASVAVVVFVVVPGLEVLGVGLFDLGVLQGDSILVDGTNR
jgi:hypothetical protein